MSVLGAVLVQVPPELTGGLPAVTHAIQLALTPVFLLAGIGPILVVLTGRLTRAADRLRAVTSGPTRTQQKELATRPLPETVETLLLYQRVRLINAAVALCVASELLVAGVVAALFIGAIRGFSVGEGVAVVFAAAMVSLILGLLCFLREIQLAIRCVRLEISRQ